jgi:hypothetical protein
MKRLNWRLAICIGAAFLVVAPLMKTWWGNSSQAESIGVAALAGATAAAIGLGIYKIWTRLRQPDA